MTRNQKNKDASLPRDPLLFCIPTSVAILIMVVGLCTPPAGFILARHHPVLAILLGAAVGGGYMLLRWEWGPNKRQGFGPAWLDLVDMGVVFGNIILILFGCWRVVALIIWGA